MARSTVLMVACLGLIWISRSMGAALLEVHDDRAAVGLPSPQPMRAAPGARTKVPAQRAAQAQRLRSENFAVIATNEPVEHPGLYASLLRADAADMSAKATYGESTWQGATSSAIQLRAPLSDVACVSLPALQLVAEDTCDQTCSCITIEYTCDSCGPTYEGTCYGETCEDPTCNEEECGETYYLVYTCEGTQFTCYGGTLCGGVVTCFGSTVGCDGETVFCPSPNCEAQRAQRTSRPQVFLTKMLAKLF